MWSQDDKLIGIARALSDDATICSLQDILVDSSFQRAGGGRALFAQVKERYQHARQMVLITDDEPQQRAFCQAMGLTEGSDMKPGPARVFARFQ